MKRTLALIALTAALAAGCGSGTAKTVTVTSPASTKTPKVCVTALDGLRRATGLDNAAGLAALDGNYDTAAAKTNAATRIIRSITPEYRSCMAQA
jgi:hypothetical protein